MVAGQVQVQVQVVRWDWRAGELSQQDQLAVPPARPVAPCPCNASHSEVSTHWAADTVLPASHQVQILDTAWNSPQPPSLSSVQYLELQLCRALQPGRAAASMRTKKRAGAGPQRQLSQLVHFVLEHVRQQAAAGSGSGNRLVTGPGPQSAGCQKYIVCSGPPGTANTCSRLVLRSA